MLIERDSRIVESRLDTSGGSGAEDRPSTVVESSTGPARTPPMEAAWLQIVGPVDTRRPGPDDTGIFPHDGRGD